MILKFFTAFAAVFFHYYLLDFSDVEECQNALVDEYISCMNLISYTCQFVQPKFQFRLLPAKLIIQEARAAEKAAEVCRSITRKTKERLEKV